MISDVKQKNIPRGWRFSELRDICSFEPGQKAKEGEENYLEIGDVDVINKDYNLIGKEKKTVKGAVKVPKNTLLISKVRPTRGAIVLTKDVVNVSNGFCRLKTPNKFFYYIVNQDKFLNYLGGQAKGSTYPTCKDENILEYKIIYPVSESEQQKIAEILETVDRGIEKTDEIIAETEKLKSGLMKKIFSNRSGWKIVEVGSLGEIITGSTPKTSDIENYGDSYIWISPKDIMEQKYINKSSKMLSERGFTQTRKISKGAILVVCIGSTIGKIGIAAEEMSTNQQINSLVVNNDNNGEFIYYALVYNKPKIFEKVSTQAIPIINKTTFSKIKITIPKRKQEQQKIAEILSSIDEKNSVNKKLKEKFILLKKGLMQDLLSGKVRVKI